MDRSEQIKLTYERHFPRMVPGPSGCFLYLGGDLLSSGHRRVWFGQKKVLIHRLVWEFHRGPIPPGLQIQHTCDVPNCCNVDHLEIGTHADNMRDMAKRGRSPWTKLTPDDVRFVRENYVPGETTQQDFADWFGVSQMQISRVIRRKNRQHVE